MRILSIILLATLAGSGLASCAGSSVKTTSRTFGLTSGPLPPPQPFVTQSRPGPTRSFPAVGTMPPARDDTLLSVDQRKKLETSLLATPGRKPTPAKASSKKKKPVGKPPKTGFFPPDDAT